MKQYDWRKQANPSISMNLDILVRGLETMLFLQGHKVNPGVRRPVFSVPFSLWTFSFFLCEMIMAELEVPKAPSRNWKGVNSLPAQEKLG